MESEQNMRQALTQAAFKAIKVVNDGSERGRKPCWKCKDSTTNTKSDLASIKAVTFDWKAIDMCHELNDFEIKVRNIFLTNNCNMQESEKVPIIMND